MAKQAKPPRGKAPKMPKTGKKMRVIPDVPPGTGRISDEAIERWLSSLPRARELVRVKG